MSRDATARWALRMRGPAFAVAMVLTGVIAGVLFAALPAGLAIAQLSNPRFPALTGRIVDGAGLLNAQDRAEIEARLKALEGKATDQLVVVTVRSLEGYAVEDYAIRLARHWKIGQQGTNNGVVLLVAPNDRKVRIEVGRGLEGQLTDAMSALIVANAILPAFRRGEFATGIKAGVRDITDVLLGDAEAVRQRAARLKSRDSGLDPVAVMILLFWLAVVGFIVYAHIQQARSMPAGAGRRIRRSGRGRDDPGIIIIPGGFGGSGNWGGGGSDGGWSGGGGGDFGGGGSSGSW